MSECSIEKMLLEGQIEVKELFEFVKKNAETKEKVAEVSNRVFEEIHSDS